jgi:nucleosome binding factor SPN SPT16 subunit
LGRGKRNTAVIEQKLRQDHTAEEKRKSHQQELMEKMNENALKRIKEGGTDKVETKVCKGVLCLVLLQVPKCFVPIQIF